jgi:hypothetical protein
MQVLSFCNVVMDTLEACVTSCSQTGDGYTDDLLNVPTYRQWTDGPPTWIPPHMGCHGSDVRPSCRPQVLVVRDEPRASHLKILDA